MNKTRLTTRTGLNNYKTCIIAFTILLGLSSITIAAIAPAKTQEPKDAQFEAYVVGVTDGDTITVLTNQKEQIKIRLYGVDAPEKKQAYGTKSKQFLSDLVFNKRVTIQPFQRDLYGRLVAKVYIEGRDIGLTIIEYGMGWWYQQYAKKATGYRDAQIKAKKQQLGLWADTNPIAPWMFRKNKKEE